MDGVLFNYRNSLVMYEIFFNIYMYGTKKRKNLIVVQRKQLLR